MYSKLNRIIVLFAMLVCLPLNGLAALAMPTCDMHDQNMVMQADDGQMDTMPGCDHRESKPESGKTPCDKCLSCHMASSQAVIPMAFALQGPVSTQKFSAVLSGIPQSVSTSLFRPPIPAFA